MRRLTIRTKDGKAALNCYDCMAQHATIRCAEGAL